MTLSSVPWSKVGRWAALSISAVAAAVAVVYLLLWYGPDVLARHDIGNVHGALRVFRLEQAGDAARGRLLTLGAGLFAAGALFYTARNFALSRRQLLSTEKAQQRTLELTEQGQVTDRYTRAIEQLGSDKPDVRIGGLYALERIARDSARDHPTVMEVLTAFVREHSREQWPLPEPGAREAPVRSTRPDVQAAVTVIARRNISHDRQAINLRDAHLAHANLASAHLAGANLTRVHLTGADLTGVNLTSANLTDADLTDAKLNVADLRSAKLSSAYLTRADLSGAVLADTQLRNADLTYAKLPGVDLTGADLTAADLTNTDLTNTELVGASLFQVHLSGTNLTGANLTGANLTGANLIGADLTTADLTNADLVGAELTGAVLSEGAQVPEGWFREPGSSQLARER